MYITLYLFPKKMIDAIKIKPLCYVKCLSMSQQQDKKNLRKGIFHKHARSADAVE